MKQRRPAKTRRFTLHDPLVKMFVFAFVAAAVLFLGVFTYYYVKYERIVDRRMAGPIFSNAARIYARAQTVSVGEKTDAATITGELRRAGYSEQGREGESPLGQYRMVRGGIEIMPGPESFHGPERATLHFEGGKVTAIDDGEEHQLGSYELEPQLVTALFEGQDRSKRELIKFDIPPRNLVDAVLAIEDRRFFQHSGVNYFRLMEAGADRSARRPARTGRLDHHHAALARLLPFAGEDRQRKLIEMMIAIELEQKFSKQRIFEMYANQVYMGQRGSFTINGFGEASRAYFNKDVKNLTLPEAALLAGMIQRPNYLSPYKNPTRALERRNLVLDSMVDTGAITREQAERAKATPLKLAAPNVEASDAPYFVDLVKDQLSPQYNEAGAERSRAAHLHHHRSRPAARGGRGRRRGHEAGGRAGGEAAHPQDQDRHRQGCDHRNQGGHRSHAAGGAGGARPAHRRGAGAGGRTEITA